jgi:hypothetical protein
MRDAASIGRVAMMGGVDDHPYQSPRSAQSLVQRPARRNRLFIVIVKVFVGVLVAMGFIPVYTVIIFNPLVAILAVNNSALFILGMIVIYFLGGYTGY